ncbi:MAG: histidinol dehydrogenase, partial [Muribaculaceae bacterium]|nr:histidinol dehydrogenase [Muribaculaceae bacterium]
MEIILNPAREAWGSLCVRNIPDDSDIEIAVRDIIDNVRSNGDKALMEYARRFDKFEGDSLLVSEEEISERAAMVMPEVAEAITKAAENISAFHKAQLPQPVEVATTPGVRCIQKAVAISRVGLYIP